MASSAACAMMLSHAVLASVGYTATGSTYSQNFDSLPNSPNNGSQGNSPLGWEDDTASPGAGNFSIVGWYLYHPTAVTEGGFNGHQRLRAGDGGSSTGAFYSYGASGSTNRALGDLGANTLSPDGNFLYYGLNLENDTGQTLTNFTLSFTGEQWRNGGSGKTDSIAFGYSTTANSSNWFSASFTNDNNLTFNSPVNTGTAGALDGTSAANQQNLSDTITGVNWAPGTDLWLRWSSLQLASSNDDGLAIDNLSFSAISAARAVTWNNAAANNNWNTSDANFTTGSGNTAYIEGDLVTFGDTAVGSVNIAAGGVSPGAVSVTNNSGEYTFSGGAINGSTSLVKSGTGTLTLTAANGYTGGTNVTGGVVNFSNDNQLGAATGSVTVGGGTLRATTSISSARILNVSAGTIDIGTGNTFSTSGAFNLGAGLFTKTGNGTLAATGPWNVGTVSMMSIPSGTLVIQPNTGSVNLSADNVGNNYVGDVIVDLTNDTGAGSSTRINFGSNETISGGGKIKIVASGSSLTTVGTSNIVANVQNEIVLNSNNNPGPFTVNVGAVGGQTLEVGVISGNSAVNLGASGGTGGSGAVLLNGSMTYTGGTTVNTGVTAGAGVVRLNTSNAFPTNGSITFNTAASSYSGPAPIDLNGHNQTISGLSVGGGGGTLPSIVTNEMGSSTSVLTINAVGSTTFSGQINDGTVSGAVMSLSKTGSGTFVFSGNGGYTGTTTVNSSGGALVLKGSSAWNPALNSAGQTDIQAGKLVFDYSSDSDPVATVLSDLATAASSGFAAGQIHSSTAQDLAHPRALGYFDDGANLKLTVAYTLAGDANMDGTVNALDFNALATAYGTSPASNTWSQGDFDYSGTVGSNDFDLLAENYNLTIGGLNADVPDALQAAVLGAVVPEPGCLGMALACGAALLRRRRRR